MKDAAMITRCVQHDMIMQEITDKLSNLTMLTNKIHDSLLGEYDKQGLISKVVDVEKRVMSLENVRNSINKKMWSVMGFLGMQVIVFIVGILTGTITVSVGK